MAVSATWSQVADNYGTKNLTGFMYFKNKFKYLLLCVSFLASTGLFAASVSFIKVETIIVKPQQAVEVLPYSINLESYPGATNKTAIQYSKNIKSNFIYLTKVAVDNKFYYRLVTGNFKSRKQAGLELSRIKKYYQGAWVNSRSRQEQQQLSRLITPVKKQQPVQKVAVPKVALKNNSSADLNSADKLLDQAKQEFLDGNYTRVLAIANKVIEIGTTEQAQMAMELSGIARERQNKFAQAVAIYTDFLYLYPDSEMSAKIKSRLDGLKTMGLEPKSRIDPDKRRSADGDWNTYGALSQYYRHDVIERENSDTQITSSVLVTDIDLFATARYW
jgi:DNA primase